MSMTLYDLERRVAERAVSKPPGSYTARLLAEGAEKCAKKVGEEAVEFALAAQYDERDAIIGEAADLFYHTLVTLHLKGITLADVEDVLALRDAQRSGNPKSDNRGT